MAPLLEDRHLLEQDASGGRYAPFPPESDCEAASSADESLDHLELPRSLRVLGPDGKVTRTSLRSATSVAVCCDLPPPPGGWWGPFGFFRLVSYAFMGLMLLAVSLAVLAVVNADVRGLISALILLAAAALSAIAAYAHEGLAHEASEVAGQNKRFAEKNVRLSQQIKDLGSVGQRLSELGKTAGVHADELEETMRTLHQLTATTQLTTMLRAFLDADSCGDRDRRLSGAEVDDFFDSSEAILKEAAPGFDFESMKAEARNAGLDLCAMRLMANAVIASGDDAPAKALAELSLVEFSLDPEGRLPDCRSALRRVLRQPEAKISRVLRDLADSHADGSGIVPCQGLLDLSRQVMLSTAA